MQGKYTLWLPSWLNADLEEVARREGRHPREILSFAVQIGLAHLLARTAGTATPEPEEVAS